MKTPDISHIAEVVPGIIKSISSEFALDKIYTNSDGSVVLVVKADMMSAWLTIKQTGRLIDENEIIQLIESAGIRNGFDEALRWMEEEGIAKDFDTPFPMAVSHINKNARQLTFFVDRSDPEDFEKNQDYSSMCDKTVVTTGTVIAGYNYRLFDGNASIYDIFGEMHAKTDTQEDDIAGQNVEYDIHGQHFIALKDGYPYLDSSGRICILDRIKIDSASIPEGGILRSPIHLILLGDLQNCEVWSRDTIEVHGNVTNCAIFTEADLIVHGKIGNCQHKWIHVLGNTKCFSITDSRLLCKGNLHFTIQLVNSLVIAEAGVEGDHDCSVIISGQTLSSGDISVFSAGAEDAGNTEIEITISPYLKNLLMIKTRELLKLKQNEANNEDAIHALNDELKSLEFRLNQEMNEFLRRPKEPRKMIKVFQDVYPPAYFRILKHSYNIKHHQNGMELVERE